MGSREDAFQAFSPLAGGWGQRPRIAEQSSAAAQTNILNQKSVQQAKEKSRKSRRPKVPEPHQKQFKAKSINAVNGSAAKRTTQ